jgi:hypothetical protein
LDHFILVLDFLRRNRNRTDVKKDGGVKQRVFCVTHAPPLVPDALADYVIGLGDYHPTRGAHISVLNPFWDRMRPYSFGAAGNYAIPNAIDAAGNSELTGIFSHRKIVVRTQTGKRSPALDFMFEVDAEDADQIPRDEIEPRPGFDFLIGFPYRGEQSVVAQYIDDHAGIDLFDYITIAVELGVLSLDEAQEFAKERFLIPGGCEMGIYPTAWVRPVLEKLAAVGREFVTRRSERIRSYDSYQVRAVGFLAERLGSYFLLTELRKRYPAGLPAGLCGCLCVIVPPGGSYGGARV